MKLSLGAVSAALIAAAAAQAEPLAPSYRAVSDFDGPYADQPLPPAPVPAPPPYGYAPGPAPAPDYAYRPDDRYPPQRPYRPEGYAPDYGYAPAFLPAHEVYAILRDHGFSPLGAPRQRGHVYVVAVLDRDGEDGKLVIDAVSGRIIRFVPASRWGGDYERMRYAPPRGQIDSLPPPTVIRADPRLMPPAPVPSPRVASRVALPPAPKLAAPAVRPAAPAAQTAALNPKPAEAKPVESPPAPQATATVTQPQPAAEPKPAPQTTASVTPPKPAAEQKPMPRVLPTQAMPPVQGLE
ncbi:MULTISPECIES: hypothetical protein [unclassified Bradyrhizobium]|uniref:hypothetical protein n=1 Tax=unclassified Bradyrhizobium TaxID=2631580 RepID=UPI0028EB5393|nr:MULTISPECIES: hypothetical protein [unclassified Bradyrhizobium]